jgi:hypothetical protein
MKPSITGVLTDEYLAQVQRRADAATAGPWISFVEGRDHTSGSSFVRTSSIDIELSGATVADQDFIAHARDDVPLLLAEIRRLREELIRRTQ